MEVLLSAAISVAMIFIIIGLICGVSLAGIAMWQLHTIGWTPETPATKFLLKLMDNSMWIAGGSTVAAGLIKLAIFII